MDIPVVDTPRRIAVAPGQSASASSGRPPNALVGDVPEGAAHSWRDHVQRSGTLLLDSLAPQSAGLPNHCENGIERASARTGRLGDARRDGSAGDGPRDLDAEVGAVLQRPDDVWQYQARQDLTGDRGALEQQ